ncbi:MAG: hypothetical protein IKZ74_07625, partial [Clostridiales bacterium]|nr:hypothetical protein [Clostridiales bacterium]
MLVVLAASWWSEFWEAFCEKLSELFGVFTGKANIGEEIRSAILQWKRFIPGTGETIPITDAIIVMWIAVFLGGLLFVWLGHRRDHLPGARQTLMEA